MEEIERAFQTELNADERAQIEEARKLWRRHGSGANLKEWFEVYGPVLRQFRRLARKLAHTDRQGDRRYNAYYGEMLRAIGVDTKDKSAMTEFTAIVWFEDDGERRNILNEILDSMTPGQRSRLNTPNTARQRVHGLLKARELGTEEKLKASPLRILKEQNNELIRQIAHLQEQLAASDGSRFDLKQSSAKEIISVFLDGTAISERKATEIANGILAEFKARRKQQKPAG